VLTNEKRQVGRRSREGLIWCPSPANFVHLTSSTSLVWSQMRRWPDNSHFAVPQRLFSASWFEYWQQHIDKAQAMLPRYYDTDTDMDTRYSDTQFFQKHRYGDTYVTFMFVEIYNRDKIITHTQLINIA
jgi:hypothetical protein